MRTRLLLVALTSSVVALLLFLIPLVFAVFSLNMGSVQSRIQSEALNAAISVDPAFSTSDLTELPDPGDGTLLGLYDFTGKRVLGSGPASADALVTDALRGKSQQGVTGGLIVATVPLTSSERVTGVVRASTPVGTVWQQSAVAWLVLAVASVVALLVGVAAAIGVSRRVIRPITVLATTSARLGAGDFTVRMLPSGIAEIDLAGTSLNVTAQRLGELVRRERELSAQASHQLRTPLAGLYVVLERIQSEVPSALRPDVDDALERSRSLESTIDEIIALAREPLTGKAIDASAQLDSAERRWRGTLGAIGRSISVEVHLPVARPVVAESALRQVLDVLIDNAVKHGSGRVIIRARDLTGAVAFDVEDEGTEVPEDDAIFEAGNSRSGSSGIGLAFARQLAADHGGRLQLSARHPHTRFTAIFPAGGDEADAAAM